ncbi:TPA: hypothetical protein OKV73_001817 [Escherichia albertii]|uniref:hypothetical protein n=1 Tax=Escherichia albertii TaxID=208962 RepID=UPI000743D471|nr:hypothetical protein [Escherichia albertii]HCQ4574095.1 hypothetical protein [Escherichia albertii]
MLIKKWYVWLVFVFLPLLAWQLVSEGTQTSPQPQNCKLSPYVDYEPAPVFTRWQWIPAKAWDSAKIYSNNDILVWLDGKKRVVANEATLLIDGNWQTLAPVLSDLLEKEKFKLQSTSMPIVYLEDDWGQVLLSHRPEIANRLAQQFIIPRLQKAEQDGDITAEEVVRKTELAISQHWLWEVWRDKRELEAELQKDTPLIIAIKTYNTGNIKRTTYMKIMDASSVFGQSKIALTLTTCDIVPNPEYSIKKAAQNGKSRLADFNLFGSTIPRLNRYLIYRLVPDESIKPILDLLKEKNFTSELTSTAMAWIKSSPVPEKTPEHQPQNSISPGAVSVETISFNEIFPDTDDSRMLKIYKELPNDRSLFATTRYDQKQHSNVAELYITESGNPRQVTRLWQGENLFRLELVHQGTKAWFEASSRQWFEVDILNRKITAMTTPQTQPDTYSKSPWFRDSHDEPIAFHYDYSEKGKGCLVFQRMDPRLLTTENVILRTCRNHYASSNSILPVLISTPGYFWLEDSNGLVKLNARTGRAESSYAVPFRVARDIRTQSIDLSNDNTTKHTPTPLGSSEAHWIALHYQILFPPLNRLSEYATGSHFIDTLSGKWRFSAELKNADSIDATARSAHGRFYAQAGCQKPVGMGTKIDIWEVTSAKKVASFQRPKFCGLAGMAFNWQGNTLILAYGDQWVRVRLPDGMHDAASGNVIPVQAQE